MALLGNRAFADVVSLDEVILDLGGSSIQYDRRLYKKTRHRPTGRRPCEDRGSDGSDVSTGQGMPRAAGNPESQEGGGERPPLTALGGDRPTGTLNLDFGLRDCETVKAWHVAVVHASQGACLCSGGPRRFTE